MANLEHLARPITRSVAVTAGASALSGGKTRALYVGTSGNVTVTYADGTSDTLQDLAAGVWHPMEVTHVTAATASEIHAGY